RHLPPRWALGALPSIGPDRRPRLLTQAVLIGAHSGIVEPRRGLKETYGDLSPSSAMRHRFRHFGRAFVVGRSPRCLSCNTAPLNAMQIISHPRMASLGSSE
ncbi:hypothetical protein K523DRAFT_382091, partial [Schizophyllum commune Tattone D]